MARLAACKVGVPMGGESVSLIPRKTPTMDNPVLCMWMSTGVKSFDERLRSV